MQRQTQDDSAVVGENMEAKRMAFDRCRTENAHVYEFILV
jgi:hypothetical protein